MKPKQASMCRVMAQSALTAVLLSHAATDGAITFDVDEIDPKISLLQIEHSVRETFEHLVRMTGAGVAGIDRTALHTTIRHHTQASSIMIIILIVVLAFTGLLSVAIGIFFYVTSKIVGEFIKGGIQTFDKIVIGTKVTFKNVLVDLIRGRVVIENMTVHNPLKSPAYETDHLFHVGEVRISLHMWNFVRSRMKNADVTELVFKDASVNYERPALCSNHSNVQDVLDFLSGRKNNKKERGCGSGCTTQCFPSARREESRPLDFQKPMSDLKGVADYWKNGTDQKVAQEADIEIDDKDKLQVSVAKLDIDGVSGAANIRGTCISLSLPTITSDDFQKECGGSTVQDVVRALVMKIGMTIIERAVHLK